jgi:hypothetical protein
MRQAAFHDIQWLGHDCRRCWRLCGPFGIWNEYIIDEECGVSLGNGERDRGSSYPWGYGTAYSKLH